MVVLQVVLVTKVSDQPEVWCGLDRERRPVHVRYDRSNLTVNTGRPGQYLASMADNCIYSRFIEDGPSRLSYRHLRDLTSDKIQWPESELPANDPAANRLRGLYEKAASEREDDRQLSLKLNAYIHKGRLMIPRSQPQVESLFTTSPDHDCRRMGCTTDAHVVLRR